MSVNGRTLTRPNLLNPSIFDDFFKPWNELVDSRWPYIGQAPAVNIKETDKDYEIIMAAPGLEKKDFEVDVNGTLITISAKREEEKEEEKDDLYTRKEYSYSSFSRSFTLPENIDSSKIDATYVHGELKLNLPKKEAAKKSTHQKINVH